MYNASISSELSDGVGKNIAKPSIVPAVKIAAASLTCQPIISITPANDCMVAKR